MGFLFMRSKAEKERATKAEEKKRVELMDWEARRQYYRDIPGQNYEITKTNFDGRGNNKCLALDVEEEPTRDMIATRFLDAFGGGSYIVYVHLPFGRMKFATFTLEGDPILPQDKEKKPKDPVEGAIADAIRAIPPESLRELGKPLLYNKLGITMPVNPNQTSQWPIDPAKSLKIQMAQDLFAKGKHSEAKAMLDDKEYHEKEHGTFETIILKKAAENVGDNLFGGGSKKSEKAEEIEAYGFLADKISLGVERVATKVMRGKARDDDSEGEDLGYEYQCAHCGKTVPEASQSCPHCGFSFAETPPPAQAPTSPPPMVEPPAPPQPLGATPQEPPQAPPEPQAPPTPSPPPPPPPPPPAAQAPAPTPVVRVEKQFKLSQYEKDFIYEALPRIYVNRIKRHYGISFDFWFKLSSAVAKFSKPEYCAPEMAARYDADYLRKKHPKEIPKVIGYAKIGFEGMIGRYKNMVDAQIVKYDRLSKELCFIKEAAFKAKYPEVTEKDLDTLGDYRNLKSVWDFMQHPKAIAWWNLYCPELVKSLEGTPAPPIQQPPPPTPSLTDNKGNPPSQPENPKEEKHDPTGPAASTESTKSN